MYLLININVPFNFVMIMSQIINTGVSLCQFYSWSLCLFSYYYSSIDILSSTVHFSSYKVQRHQCISAVYDSANMKVALFLCFVTPLPLLVRSTSFKMDFLSSGTVRTDPLMYSQTGDCLSDHVHRFYGAVSSKTMRPEVTFQDLR